MKRKLIIGVVLAITLGFGGWKIWTDNNSRGQAEETKESTSINSIEKNEDSENIEDKEENQSSNLNKSETNLQVGSSNKITGSQTDLSNKNKNKNTGNNSNNSEDLNQSYSTNIKTPYDVLDTGMQITEIFGYSGPFVENGKDEKVSKILSLKVKNTSKKDLQYGQIKIKINDKKTVTFNLTNLPSGKTVTVMESTGKISYNSGDNYKYEDSTYGLVDELPMNTKKVKVSTRGSMIAIENISGKDLGTVYVYYKNVKDSSYLGGITYRAKFEDVKKGESYVTDTSHFSKDDSEIIMVDTEN